MANVALHQLLGATVVTRAISRIKTPMSRFQDWLGMGPGGSANNPVGGDKFGWDVMDNVREIATGRPPGTGPANVAPHVFGHVTASAYRAHEKVMLLEARIFRTRPLGGQWGSVDRRGQAYVTRQERRLSQRFRNNREFMISRMLRGGFDISISGDNWVPVELSAGNFSIDFQIPSANKSQFANLMGSVGSGASILDTSWATIASADIPNDLLQINAAFEANHGYPLRHVWCNSVIIDLVMNNSKMQALAGTANRVFNTFQPSGLRNVEGIEDTGFSVRFNAVPWVQWHVYDAGLDVNGTYTKFLTDTTALFLPDPSPDWAEWYEGSEIVAENVLDPGNERLGFSAWTTRVIDPAGFEMKAVDIGLPVLYIPKAVAYGTVVF